MTLNTNYFRMEAMYIIGSLSTIIISLLLIYNGELAYATSTDSYIGGYRNGYSDGLNNPFNKTIPNSNHTENYVEGYLNGFMDGCLDVSGNTIRACENAKDT